MTNPDGIDQANLHISLDVLIKLIPEFDGKPDDLHTFIDRVSDAVKLCNPKQKSIILTFIKAKLKGNAQVPILNNDFTSWDQLKRKLIETYSDKKSFAQAQLELQNTRQYANELISAYTQRIETCIRRLINTLSLEIDERPDDGQIEIIKKMGLSAFINGVRPEYRLILRSRDPLTVQQASKIAQNEELTLKLQNLHVSYNRTNHHNNSQNNSPRRVNFVEKFCKYCKRKGHTIEECRTRERNNRTRPNNYNHMDRKPNYNYNPSNYNSSNYNPNLNSNTNPNSSTISKNGITPQQTAVLQELQTESVDQSIPMTMQKSMRFPN